jgi:hypothetical protein
MLPDLVTSFLFGKRLAQSELLSPLTIRDDKEDAFAAAATVLN